MHQSFNATTILSYYINIYCSYKDHSKKLINELSDSRNNKEAQLVKQLFAMQRGLLGSDPGIVNVLGSGTENRYSGCNVPELSVIYTAFFIMW